MDRSGYSKQVTAANHYRSWQQPNRTVVAPGKAATCELPWHLTLTTALTHHRGFFGKGDMQKEFEEAAFALEKGQVSGVVDTASGIHLIQR